MRLVSPSSEYQVKFARFFRDFERYDPDNADYYRRGVTDFKRYIQNLSNEEQGINLPKGYAPCSHFWMIADSGDMIGAIRVRHILHNEFLQTECGHIGYDIAPSYRSQGHGTHMLHLVLVKALQLGIETALVTADDDNYASRKVIENNGGVLDEIVYGKVFERPIARYWVSCV